LGEIEDQFGYALEECRMVLPGIQTLFGFQLMATFSNSFFSLSPMQKAVHVIILVLQAVTITLVLIPAAVHRANSVSEDLVNLTTTFLRRAMIFLNLSLAMDIYLVTMLSLKSNLLGLGVALVMVVFTSYFWFIYPRRWR
jgi:hypothetical protein